MSLSRRIEELENRDEESFDLLVGRVNELETRLRDLEIIVGNNDTHQEESEDSIDDDPDEKDSEIHIECKAKPCKPGTKPLKKDDLYLFGHDNTINPSWTKDYDSRFLFSKLKDAEKVLQNIKTLKGYFPPLIYVV